VAKPKWLDDRQQHLWQSYLHANQHLYAFLEQELARDGLSGPDFKVLHPVIAAPDGVLRARELGAEIGWDRGRLSHHLARMERRGLIIREECAEDGRGLMVRVTDAGRIAMKAAAPAHVENTRRYFFDLLSDDEVETLTAVFDRMLERLPRDNS
jgi:DNA-binding MarR family transcriptional regulator